MPMRPEVKARIDILSMDAGDDLDAMVAERVFGYPILRTWKDDFYGAANRLAVQSKTDRVVVFPMGGSCEYWFPREWHKPHPNIRYSTEIEAAWEVIDNLDARGVEYHPTVLRTFTLKGERGPWRCRIGNDIEADADTPMLAICRAALLAVLATLCPTETAQ